MPRLSVALPVHNGENYLAAAIESILGQSFGDFTLFVSENASTDATPDILADAARRDRRVRVSRVPTLVTQIENINRVVRGAPGSWVKLICHDDLMRVDCLAQIDAVLDTADEERIGLIANGEAHLFGNGYATQPPEVEPVRLSGRDAATRGLTGGGGIVIPSLTTATVRKAAFEQVGGIDSRYPYLGDHFCWLEVLARWNYIYLGSPLTTNRLHGGQSAARMTQQLISVGDLRRFLPDYIARHAGALDLSRHARWRAKMRPVSEAATKITTEWLAGRGRNIGGMVRQVPAHWLPLLVPLCLRAWTKQRQGIENLANHVPLSMIYP